MTYTVYCTYPIDKDGLYELYHLQGDLQADGDEVVVEDDEGQEVVAKIGSC